MAGAALANSACSGEDERPRPIGSAATGSGATGGSAGSSGGAGARDAAASDGSAGSRDGAAGAEGGGVCGDGIADSEEQCDKSDLKGTGCTDYGFDTGTLRCSSTCLADTSGCSGTESCFDGRDNDGDGAVDCSDSNCMAACLRSCGSAPALADPTNNFQGATVGHASEITSSCAGAGSGPEVAFQFIASGSGILDVELIAASANLNLSVRRNCSAATSELGCSERAAGGAASERLRLPIVQGETVFIVIDGTGASEAGTYTLSARSRPITCGDGIRDDSERCDDGNTASGDGCSASCSLESEESEPNGDPGSANNYTGAPFFAEIAPAGDRDVFRVTVQNPASTLRAETLDLGDSACPRFLMDSFVEILGPDGTTILASDDDTLGFCARATASGLGAGSYYVRVRSSDSSATFPYNLKVSVTP